MTVNICGCGRGGGTFAARQRFAKPTRDEAQRVTVSRAATTTVIPNERMRFAVRAALV